MLKKTKIALLAGAVVAVTATPVVAETTSPATPAGKAASVSGSAQMRLTFFPDRDTRAFAFDARAVPYSSPKPGAPEGMPTDATGTVRIYHHSPDAGVTVRAKATVDCLVTSPGNATLTAVVSEANEPVKDWVGKRLGFTVHDGGPGGRHDRVGFSWAVVNGVEDGEGGWEEAETGTCMGPAAFAPVVKGDYRVKHADLLPQPTG